MKRKNKKKSGVVGKTVDFIKKFPLRFSFSMSDPDNPRKRLRGFWVSWRL